jgi:lysozyme
MSAADLAIARLITEEGYRQHVYKDTQGHPSIGYGLNLDAGIDRELAMVILGVLVKRIDAQLAAYWWYPKIDAIRQSVFVDVAYNCGVPGLLHFVHCINAAAAGNWQEAHDALLNSDAARLNVARYQHLAQVLLTGVEA